MLPDLFSNAMIASSGSLSFFVLVKTDGVSMREAFEMTREKGSQMA